MSQPEPALEQILLVEDLALHRRVIPVRLGILGRNVSAVANASDAEAFLADHHPDLILMDVILPGKDGFTLCREIKADPARRDSAVMILSDLKGDAFERSLEADADDYLPKSMDDAVLRIRVRLLLQLQSLRKKTGKRMNAEPCSILLVTPSPALRGQLAVQTSQDGHTLRAVASLDELDRLTSDDQILIIDMTRDPSGLHEALMGLRMDPATQNISVMLLCEKVAFPLLPAIESMVDDVLWKPINGRVARFRLNYLAELAQQCRVAGR